MVPRENLRRRRFLVRARKSDSKTFAGKKLIEVSSWFKHRDRRRAIDFSPESEDSERGKFRSLLFHVDLSDPSGCAPRINSPLGLSNEQLRGSPPSTLPLRNWWRAQWRTPAFPAFVSMRKVSPFLLPCVFLLVATPRFSSGRRWTAAAWAGRCRGWEGRANRSRLGLFASYRVGVKINVNFAVELISPTPINPTSSLSPLLSRPLFLSVCSSLYSAFPLRVSLYLFLFPVLAFPTGVPLRTFPLVLRFHALNLPQGFLKLENFRGEKKHRVSAAFGKKLPNVLSRIVPCRNPRAFCRDYLRQIVFLLCYSRVGIYSALCFICVQSAGRVSRNS